MDFVDRLIARIPRAIRWLVVACWMGVLFYLSSLTGTSLPGRFASLAHFSAYAVLGLLAWIALENAEREPRVIAFAIMIASAYGITDEIHQAFVPGRTPDVADWGFDTLGALTGAVLIAWLAKKGARRRPSA